MPDDFEMWEHSFTVPELGIIPSPEQRIPLGISNGQIRNYLATILDIPEEDICNFFIIVRTHSYVKESGEYEIRYNSHNPP